MRPDPSETVIRAEAAADAPEVHAVVEAAFGRALAADLVDQIRADGDSVIALVAVAHAEIIGHVLFSKMTAPSRALGLAPVSVRPDRQRTGVGGRLIREGMLQAQEAGWEGVFVLGEPDYYGRFGFSAERAGGFASPYAGPYLMAASLGRDLPAAKGVIGYARAFSALG